MFDNQQNISPLTGVLSSYNQFASGGISAAHNEELERCKKDRAYWFKTYFKITNPKVAGTGETTLGFELRPRQIELDNWWSERERKQETGIVVKSREEGATWYAVGRALHVWLFIPSSVVTFGSRKEELVDKSGDPDSIFSKIRFSLDLLPSWMLPKGFVPREHDKYLRLTNPDNKAVIKGEAGDNMGRGGRSFLYIVDEWDFVPRPEVVSRAINENAACRIYISTVAGPGTFMAAQEQEHSTFMLHWKDNPDKNHSIEEDGKIIYPWYEKKKLEYAADPIGLAREIDANRNAASPGALIPNEWIKAAQKLILERGTINASGLDVSADRGDRIVYANRQGPVLARVETVASKTIEPDVLELLSKDNADTLFYDKLGVGAYAISGIEKNPPVVYQSDEGVRYTQYLEVVPIANSEKPTKARYHDLPKVAGVDRFYNRAAELGWALRIRFMRTFERVEKGIPHPDDECISLAEFEGTPLGMEIETQLSTPIYDKDNPANKIKVEKKGLGNKSPDIYEAIMYAFAHTDVAKKPVVIFDSQIN